MKNSRLLELISTFNATEWTELGKWLRSPAINQRNDVLQLYDFLKKEKKGSRETEALFRKRAFAAVFPGEVFEEKKLGYTISFMHQSIRKWLVYKELEFNKEEFQVLLVRALRKRNLERHVATETAATLKILDQNTRRDHQYLDCLNRLRAEAYEQELLQSRHTATLFGSWAEATTQHFVAVKLRQSCTALAHRALLKVEFRPDLTEAVLEFAARHDCFGQPAIRVYFALYHVLANRDPEKYYPEVRGFLSRSAGVFSKVECRDLYLLLINYNIRQVNDAEELVRREHHLQEVLELYQQGLDQDVFIDQGVLSPFTYNNIAMAALGLQRWEWVAHFLETYREKLSDAARDSAYSYNLALFHFRQGHYDQAMRLLSPTDFTDLHHALSARRMLLRCYYELSEWTALDSLLDSFFNFLHRNKRIGYHRQHYLNLVRLTRKLLQLKPGDAAKRAAVFREAEATKLLAEREWLLSKLC